VRWGETKIQLPRSGLYRRWEMLSRIASGIFEVSMRLSANSAYWKSFLIDFDRTKITIRVSHGHQ
jgi:hypothetical protein